MDGDQRTVQLLFNFSSTSVSFIRKWDRRTARKGTRPNQRNLQQSEQEADPLYYIFNVFYGFPLRWNAGDLQLGNISEKQPRVFVWCFHLFPFFSRTIVSPDYVLLVYLSRQFQYICLVSLALFGYDRRSCTLRLLLFSCFSPWSPFPPLPFLLVCYCLFSILTLPVFRCPGLLRRICLHVRCQERLTNDLSRRRIPHVCLLGKSRVTPGRYRHLSNAESSRYYYIVVWIYEWWSMTSSFCTFLLSGLKTTSYNVQTQCEDKAIQSSIVPY